MAKSDKGLEPYKGKALALLTRHIGRQRAVGMGELYEAIFGRPWTNRQNDTRDVRALIDSLRREGVPIGSVNDQSGGGYYLMGAESEVADYCRRLRRQALKKLALEARLRSLSLPDLLGQIALNLRGCEDELAGGAPGGEEMSLEPGPGGGG